MRSPPCPWRISDEHAVLRLPRVHHGRLRRVDAHGLYRLIMVNDMVDSVDLPPYLQQPAESGAVPENPLDVVVLRPDHLS